ncbi:MAG TPA: hypothetical protein VGG35_13025 [Streptosporangiaceae bacterium]
MSKASVAVCGLDRPSATALGRRYGQDAMVELTPAFRIIVDCDSGWALPSGWPIEPIGTGHPEAARAAGGRRGPRAGEA